MIKTREDLNEWLQYEKYLYYGNKNRREKILQVLTNTEDAQIWRFVRLLRKTEYYFNNRKKTLLHMLLFLSLRRRKNCLGGRLNIIVPENTTEKGLRIYHAGIIIHPLARCGNNLQLHGQNCIGNNGKNQQAPIIGNGCDLGIGVKVLGNIELADEVKVGAGAVVVSSCYSEHVTLAGVPARIL